MDHIDEKSMRCMVQDAIDDCYEELLREAAADLAQGKAHKALIVSDPIFQTRFVLIGQLVGRRVMRQAFGLSDSGSDMEFDLEPKKDLK